MKTNKGMRIFHSQMVEIRIPMETDLWVCLTKMFPGRFTKHLLLYAQQGAGNGGMAMACNCLIGMPNKTHLIPGLERTLLAQSGRHTQWVTI